jgi:hypothetical protein
MQTRSIEVIVFMRNNAGHIELYEESIVTMSVLLI